jgi:hypothetical protein
MCHGILLQTNHNCASKISKIRCMDYAAIFIMLKFKNVYFEKISLLDFLHHWSSVKPWQ